MTITDRRVALNGPIFEGSVRPVIEKIQFYANQSDKPIFLVIDESPGGSVASGEQVIKAMESSKAPVHVVVKSFAASMARLHLHPGTAFLRLPQRHHHPCTTRCPTAATTATSTQQKEQLEIWPSNGTTRA